jgi:hypothetical protein
MLLYTVQPNSAIARQGIVEVSSSGGPAVAVTVSQAGFPQ